MLLVSVILMGHAIVDHNFKKFMCVKAYCVSVEQKYFDMQ